MKKYWRKLGLLYSPNALNQHPKLLSHAANPLPVLIKDDIYRVFFSGRDIHNRSSVGAVDVNIVTQEIIQEHPEPFFEYGPEGSFFADGISIGNCYKIGETTYMLFMGWQNATNTHTHWRGDIGRLRVTPDLRLELDSFEPFISSDGYDPISLSYPWVFRHSIYHMWYGSTLQWESDGKEMVHVINYATSTDGLTWRKQGLAIPYELGLAQAFSRPTVLTDEEGYHMWFSYRNGQGLPYRIGYAYSVNAKDWSLKLTDSGIDVSDDGWDSEMIAYPFVFQHKEKNYLLYNGNCYGQTGFGIAVQEEL